MPGSVEVQGICVERLGDVIVRRVPLGLFLAREGRKWIAVDNSTGDAWTEEFYRKRAALCWLRRAIE